MAINKHFSTADEMMCDIYTDYYKDDKFVSFASEHWNMSVSADLYNGVVDGLVKSIPNYITDYAMRLCCKYISETKVDLLLQVKGPKGEYAFGTYLILK